MNHDRKHVQQLIDLLAVFDDVKRKRDALIAAMTVTTMSASWCWSWMRRKRWGTRLDGRPPGR